MSPPRAWASEYTAHPWSWIVDSFRDLAEANPYFLPLAEFAVRLAESRYASGVFPVKSMHSIHLYQQERYSDMDAMVHVVFEAGEFVVSYVPGALRPPLTGTPAEWVRRGRDGFAILEGCFRHLGWFIEYRQAAGPG